MSDHTSDFKAPVFGMSEPTVEEINAVIQESMPDGQVLEVSAEPTPVKSATTKGPQKETKVLFVDPASVYVSHEFNGRHEPATQAEIDKLASSIAQHGQIQPGVLRRHTPKEKERTGLDFCLILGYRRLQAVAQIKSEGGVALFKATLVTTGNSADHFLLNVIENKERNDTTPIDDSYNIARLEDLFGWDSHRLAEFYGWSLSKLSQVKRLSQLDRKAQKKVATGLMSIADAMVYLKLDEESKSETLASVPDEIPPVVTEETPSGETFATNGEPVDSGHPTAILPAKRRGGKPKKIETQEDINRKAARAYATSRKRVKRTLGETLRTKAKALSGKSTQRSIQELKAALSGREDAASKILLSFMSGESNSEDLNQELNRIEEALTDVGFVTGPVVAV